MSITDELRKIATKTECANGRCEKLYRGDLEHIADRIDAEHERQCAESWMRGHDAWAAIDRSDEMAEHGWIRLPKDADGVPIRVGDVLTDGEYKFKVFELAAFGDGSWSIRNEDGNAWAACDVTHHHEPTVEDVLWEFASAYDRIGGEDDEHQKYLNLIAEFAAKLRLAGDAE